MKYYSIVQKLIDSHYRVATVAQCDLDATTQVFFRGGRRQKKQDKKPDIKIKIQNHFRHHKNNSVLDSILTEVPNVIQSLSRLGSMRFPNLSLSYPP